MSVAKRSRQPAAAVPSQRSFSQPASKRIKSSHVPTQSGLDFLVNEDARADKKLEAKLTNGVPRSKATRVDDSHAVVAKSTDDSSDSSEDEEDEQSMKPSSAKEIITISSGDESSELEEDEEEELESKSALNGKLKTEDGPLTNGHLSEDESGQQTTAGAEDVEMEDRDEMDDEDGDEITFGDLLQTRHPEPIDLQEHRETDLHDLVPANGDQMVLTGHSMGIMLNQALKTNDSEQLETCLRVTHLESIRGTIQRLTSEQAALLLLKIAERIHKRPGRTGSLSTWIQWTLTCHGGYFAHDQAIMKKIRPLIHILRQRANGLQPLLQLKGKLDLLSAQLELRRRLQDDSHVRNMENQDDERGVLYIEGKDADWSDCDEDVVEKQTKKTLKGPMAKLVQEGREDEEDDDEMDTGLPNGVFHTEDDESSDADEDMPNGVFDIEAEEASDDDDEDSSNDEQDSEDSVDEDDSSGEEESEAEVKEAKLSTLNRKR